MKALSGPRNELDQEIQDTPAEERKRAEDQTDGRCGYECVGKTIANTDRDTDWNSADCKAYDKTAKCPMWNQLLVRKFGLWLTVWLWWHDALYELVQYQPSCSFGVVTFLSPTVGALLGPWLRCNVTSVV